MAIDWSKAPDGAEFWACGMYYKHINGKLNYYCGGWSESSCSLEERMSKGDYYARPQQWPEETRIDIISTNGGDGLHYQEILSEKLESLGADPKLKTAVEFLYACVAVQSERGKQYDASGTGERSFAAAASAFNAATGKSLTGSDVCLLLTMVKLVRQYSSPNRLHQDSLLDGVSYLSLWAEELNKELGEK